MTPWQTTEFGPIVGGSWSCAAVSRITSSRRLFMLTNLKDISGHKLAATDGEIGSVKDFYFDDQSWVVRYLVADTGSWLTGRLVLLSPHAVGRFDESAKVLPVGLTKKKIEDSPSIETHKPVSRQYEVEYYRHYGWPTYWDGGGMWGISGFPVPMPLSPEQLQADRQAHRRDDHHLRSVNAVTGYAIQATDGEIGTVSSFMVDDKSWALGGMVVETGKWYAGKEILILTDRIAHISYEQSKVFVNLTQLEIKETEESATVAPGGEEPVARHFSR